MLKQNKEKRRGFTIVELIIVIVVIGILATIAIVSYSGTQNRAKKSSYEATAQQVKMKLGEYFTDNNRYPQDMTAVRSYLTSTVVDSAVKDEFKTPTYAYNAYADSSKGSCASSPCQYYEITVTKDKWGSSTDDNLVIKP